MILMYEKVCKNHTNLILFLKDKITVGYKKTLLISFGFY